VGKVVMYSSVSVDGFIADENDQPGPLFDWLSSGDVSLDESGELKVSQTSYDYTRPYWVPTADSPSPGGQQGGRRPGPPAGVPACAACSCRTCPPPACGARPAASLASRGRPRPSACAVPATPARRTRPGQPAHSAPGRRAAAVPRSRAGAPAAQLPSPGHCGTPARPGRGPGT
jgi:hypothetical protein